MSKAFPIVLLSIIAPLASGCDGSSGNRQDSSTTFRALDDQIAALSKESADSQSKIKEQQATIAGLRESLVNIPLAPPPPVPQREPATSRAPLPPLPRFRAPSMAWNAWNTFQCGVSEDLIKGAADAMVSSKMKDAGYSYIVMDDCWATDVTKMSGMEISTRDPKGRIIVDETKFPHGIKPIADYVHSKGLKFGIYSSPNYKTCAGKSGSLGYEDIDAQTFADWGVDYLKYDICGGDFNGYATMRAALDKATGPGRYVYLAWNPTLRPSSTTYPYISKVESATFAPDVGANWDSIIQHIDHVAPFAGYSVPGYTNYADMLEVGVGMTLDQQRAHFAMWAMLDGPLTAGNDIRSQSADTLSILTNKDIIAIDQDKLQLQATKLPAYSTADADISVWQRPLAENGVRAVLVLNRGQTEKTVALHFADFALSGSVQATSLWEGVDLGQKTGELSVKVPPTGSIVLRLKGTEAGLADVVDLTKQPWIYAVETAKQVENCPGFLEFFQRPVTDRKWVDSGWDSLIYCWKNDPEQSKSGLVPRVVVKDRQIVAAGKVQSSSTASSLQIGPDVFDHGFIGSTYSQIVYRLGGRCSKFTGFLGVDNQSAPVGAGTVKLEVWDDSVPLYSSFDMKKGDKATPFSIDVTNRETLRIILRGSESGLLADIASPVLECASNA